MKNRILIFDTETTGLSIKDSHIWQLTALRLDLANLPEHESDFEFDIFDAHIKPPGYPNITWNKKVEEYIKAKFEDLANMNDPVHVFDIFANKYLENGSYNWHDRFIPVCYNAHFDSTFLKKYAKLVRGVPILNSVLFKSYIDLFTLSVTYCRQFDIKTVSYKLFDMCEALGVDVSDLRAHDAKDDIKASYRLLLKLIDLGVLWSYLKK